MEMTYKKMANGDITIRMNPDQLRSIRRGLGALTYRQWPGYDQANSAEALADVDDLVNGPLDFNE